MTLPAMKDYMVRSKGKTRRAERKRSTKRSRSSCDKKMPKVTVADVADHIEYIRKIAGVDYIGIGSDFDGNTNWPEGLSDVSMYPNLFAELVRRGWSDEDLAKVAGGNVLRALEQAETVAKRLQGGRPAKA